MERVELGDLILIAETLLGLPAEEVEAAMNLPLAESALEAPHAAFGGVEFYPDLPTKAAILCSRIVRNHSLPDGNKRLGLTAMLLFLRSNGHRLIAGQDEIGDVIEALAARELAEADFVAWVESRVAPE